jgi:hypothetical protein
VYLPGGPDGTCPVFRDEPLGFDALVTYEGPAIVELYPRGPRWVDTWLERPDHTRRALSVDETVVDASGAPVGGVIEIDGGRPRLPPPLPRLDADPDAPPPYIPPLVHARIHLDLAPVVARLRSGPHRICAELRGVTQPELSIARYQPYCVVFTIQESSSTRARAEHLRRRAMDLLAKFRCDEASSVVDELLQVHPTSAVAFRLRGVIAELQQRHAAAIADYSRAIALLRGEDTLLDRSGMDVADSARALANWRDSLQLLATYAPDQSLLGPPGDRPSCKTAQGR